MHIISVQLEHTNPSMGPHEKIITYTLRNSPTHEEEFKQLQTLSKINDIDLERFLTAHKEKDAALIQEVFDANYKGRLNEGQTISYLSITLDDNTQIKISDLRTTRLTGYYPSFIQYLVQHGTRSEFGGEEFLEIPKDKPLL